MLRGYLQVPLWCWASSLLLAFAGCESSKSEAGNSNASTSGPDAGDTSGPCGAGNFDSTYAAIQKVIFEGYNYTNEMCHGAAKEGGLDLRAEASYDNLVQVDSTNSPLNRVMPADPQRSFLYNKLRAATNPGSIQIDGSPMPSGAAPLSPEHLEVVRRWIEKGAPREGSVGDDVTGRADGIADLLGAGTCLPEATPNPIHPLDPPAQDEGIQLVTAPIVLKAGTEIDVCWAQYYDLSDVVPPQYQDPEHKLIYVNGQRTRQDALSHHLVVSDSGLGAEAVHDPAFGKWSCRGGDQDGSPCEAVRKGACGAGVCASEVQNKSACIGFGPQTGAGLFGRNSGMGRITGSQTAQYYRPPRDGVYETIPIKGIMYVNPHAYNLTTKDATLRGWINHFYAKGDLSKKRELKLVNVLDKISIAAGTPPFTQKNYCSTWVAAQNSLMYSISSHTHKRGRHFTIELGGEPLYTSETYSDPVVREFDPPMLLDSPDVAKRTFKYCADYNNGLKKDGSPEVDLVTRLSTMPDGKTCKPVACVEGNVGASCTDDAACDSSEGAGDGWCDACAITGGQTSEDEMFIMIPLMVLP